MTDFNQKTHDTDVGSHGGQSRQMMEVFEDQEFGSIRVLQDAAQPKADYFDTFVNSEDAPASGISIRKSVSRRRQQWLSYWIPLSVPQSKRLADAFCRQICKGLFYCPGLLRQKRKAGAADESDLQGKESFLQVV